MNLQPFSQHVQMDTDYEQNSWGIIDILTIILVFFIILYASEIKDRVQAEKTAKPVAAPATNPSLPAFRAEDTRADEVESIRAHFAGYLEKGFYIAENNQAISLVLEEQLSFDTGAADLTAGSGLILDRIVELLKRERQYTIIVAGHSDDLPIKNGSFASNWHLASARAISVADYLIGHGIAPERISTQSFAEFKPLKPNTGEENRKRNRRVEISLSRVN